MSQDQSASAALLGMLSGDHGDHPQRDPGEVIVALDAHMSLGLGARDAFRVQAPSSVLIEVHPRRRRCGYSGVELPAIRLPFDRPVSTRLTVDVEVSDGPNWGIRIVEGCGQGIGECRQDGMKETRIGLSWLTNGVTDVLLVVPALGVFPRHIEPDRGRRGPRPTHRCAEREEVQRGEVVEQRRTCGCEQVVHHPWAQPTGGVHPNVIAAVEEADEILARCRCVALVAVAPPGEVGEVAAKDVAGHILYRPSVAGRCLFPVVGIQRGEHLSSILKRAGGFSNEAYPYAAILDRAQVRQAAAKSREDMVTQIQAQQAAGNTATTPRTTSTATLERERQQLLAKLKQIQPNGRMLIHVTSQIEKWQNTQADVEVRPGDTLYIPKRPTFVMVAGQVYNPIAITYSAGKHAGWYLKQAGGPTTLAHKKEIFVVRANGTVVGRGSGEWWSGSVLSTTLQAGDTIFVPEKGAGASIFKNISQSISLLSGAAVAVSVIRTF